MMARYHSPAQRGLRHCSACRTLVLPYQHSPRESPHSRVRTLRGPDLTVLHNNSMETPLSESIASASLMALFYATTPSPVSTIEPSLPPSSQSNHQSCVPSAVRPMGLGAGSEAAGGCHWFSRLASPIPSCTSASSSKQATV